MSNITEIKIGGGVRKIEDSQARDDVGLLLQQTNGLYKGRDLTVVFADEIAEHTDAWAWIHARIIAGNYAGIYVGDYIPITIKDQEVEMQVAGIDIYTKTLDQELGHHIDFISRDCFPETVQWNTTNNNNGNATDGSPYMVSNLHSWLATLSSHLPQAVKDHIVTKRTILETRYSESGMLTDSTGWEWKDMGLLWVPHEYEVFGSTVWGTKGYSSAQTVQYPIFANSYLNRIKGTGHGGSRCAWWLASVPSGHSTLACYVISGGYASHWSASYAGRVPICFRIAA